MIYQNKFISVETAPSVEPVSVDDFKAFTKVSGDTDDGVIEDILKAARVACEQYCSRPFVNTTYKQTQDGFEYINGYFIRLLKKDVQSVTSVKTYNQSNASTTFSTDYYFLDKASSEIVVNEGITIPTTRVRAGVEIIYISGFGATAASVPQDVKHAILMYAQTIYDFNRNVEQLITTQYQMPEGAKTLLNPYRFLMLGVNG